MRRWPLLGLFLRKTGQARWLHMVRALPILAGFLLLLLQNSFAGKTESAAMTFPLALYRSILAAIAVTILLVVPPIAAFPIVSLRRNRALTPLQLAVGRERRIVAAAFAAAAIAVSAPIGGYLPWLAFSAVLAEVSLARFLGTILGFLLLAGLLVARSLRHACRYEILGSSLHASAPVLGWLLLLWGAGLSGFPHSWLLLLFGSGSLVAMAAALFLASTSLGRTQPPEGRLLYSLAIRMAPSQFSYRGTVTNAIGYLASAGGRLPDRVAMVLTVCLVAVSMVFSPRLPLFVPAAALAAICGAWAAVQPACKALGRIGIYHLALSGRGAVSVLTALFRRGASAAFIPMTASVVSLFANLLGENLDLRTAILALLLLPSLVSIFITFAIRVGLASPWPRLALGLAVGGPAVLLLPGSLLIAKLASGWHGLLAFHPLTLLALLASSKSYPSGEGGLLFASTGGWLLFAAIFYRRLLDRIEVRLREPAMER